MKEYCPLAVLSGVPTSNGIEFQHPMQKMTKSSYTEIVWSVIRHCDGLTKHEAVVKRVVKATGESSELVTMIIDDLASLEVLIDSRMAYRYYHKLGDNLSTFSAGLTPEEVYELQMSPHLALKDGEAAKLKSTPASNTQRLGKTRFSCRNFGDEPIGEDQFSEMLRVASSKEVTASPSAGGLYPIRLYAIILRPIGELAVGLYEYDGDTHSVIRYRDELDVHELEFALNSESLLYNAPLVLVVGAELDRPPTKYANRGYRYSLIEAGHVAQSIHLVAQELELATLEYCGFQDERLSEALEIDGSGITPILTIAAGYASERAADTTDDLAAQLSTEFVGKGKPVNWVHLVNSPQSEEDYSFFHFVSHFRSGDHDEAKISYKDRLCGGTSTSFNMATVKAIAEGYERYQSSIIKIDATEAASSFGDRPWLDPRVYAPYAEAQVDRLTTLAPFTEDAQWEWVEGHNLHNGDSVMVPIDLVYYPLSSHKLGRNLCHYANSSGIAAHTTYDAAIKGALLELIERDAIMQNWFDKSSPARISSETLPLHWRKRVSHWQAEGYDVDFLNMSHDGVAIINVVMHSEDHYPHFVTGTSASIDSLDAAYTKAFHEAELTLITLRQRGRKRMTVEELAQPTDHGLLYAQKEFQSGVDYLWRGCYGIVNEPSATLESLVHKYRPCVVNLSGLSSTLTVVRVFAKDLIPVNFGYGVDHYTHAKLPDSIRKKHFSELEPHYLA